MQSERASRGGPVPFVTQKDLPACPSLRHAKPLPGCSCIEHGLFDHLLVQPLLRLRPTATPSLPTCHYNCIRVVRSRFVRCLHSETVHHRFSPRPPSTCHNTQTNSPQLNNPTPDLKCALFPLCLERKTTRGSPGPRLPFLLVPSRSSRIGHCCY